MSDISTLESALAFVDDAVNDPTRLAAVARIVKHRQWPSGEVQAVLVGLAERLEAPFSAATLIDGSEQHFLSTNGGPMASCSRDTSHCQYVIATGTFLAINNTGASPFWRRATRGLIGGQPLQAYLGAPLRVDGQVLGAVCVVDTVPREWSTDAQYEVYRAARRVAGVLEGLTEGGTRT